MQVTLSAFVGQNSSYHISYYPIRGFQRTCGIITCKVRIFVPFCKVEIPRIISVAFNGLKAKEQTY